MKNKKTRGKYHKLDAEKFIRVWQKAKTLADVVKSYPAFTAIQASLAACRLRQLGVDLKRFRQKTASHDYAGLNKLARSLSK